MKNLRVPPWLIILILSFVFTACAGLVQRGGEILEGNAFNESTVAVYRSSGGEQQIEFRIMRHRDGEEFVEITARAWPGLALRGSIPAADGTFVLTQARFLSSHVNGWNEFNLELLGSAAFSVLDESAGRLSINGEVERVQVSSGRIRLKDIRLTGDAALTHLRNRRERILAITEWMETQPGALQNLPVFADQKEFENHWKRLLFPERVPRKRRPPSTDNAEWRRADSVNWNLTYTKQLLPQELWELRNSGALLRDWEEALPWIFMEYSWNNIICSMKEINFLKVSR